MPSINLSSPAMPGLPIGLMPMPVGPVAPGAPVAEDGFAQLIASAGDAPLLEAAPASPPVIGTGLPQGRQDPAVSPEPLPEIDIENVMVGSGPVPQADAPQTESPTKTAPATTAPATGAEAAPIACGLQIWDLHGASRFAMARRIAMPDAPKPVEAPIAVSPEIPVIDARAESDAPPETAEPDVTPAPADQPAPSPVQLPFAPAEWVKDTRAQQPATTPDDVEAPDAPPAVVTVGSAKPEVPAPATPAQPGNTAATPARPILDGTNQPAPVQPTVVAPAPTAPSAPPHSFTLPPEMAREVAEMVRALSSESDDPAPASAPSTSSGGTTPIAQPTSQASTSLHPAFASAQRPAIDTGRAEWMQAMIERIAEMPQVDGKREAQIRLLPDALGAIEIKIVERQDRLHVTMNAENPHARQLLAEATPRLHELAEARGLRLGQTGVGGGEQQDKRGAPEQQPTTPLRPRPASAGAASESEASSDLIA